MNELKEKNLRPGRKITDQFVIASALSVLITSFIVFLFPEKFFVWPFEKLLGGDHDVPGMAYVP